MAHTAYRALALDLDPVVDPGEDAVRDRQQLKNRAPAWQRPQIRFERRMFADGLLTMPDGAEVHFWGFEDPAAAPAKKCMLSQPIRVREGQVVHVKLETATGAPARPRAMMCGSRLSRGPVAVQKTESFIYQWQPRSAGTWLYQSHLASRLHFEMGLFGLMIVDPETDHAGRPLAYRDGPAYTVERTWVLDDVDPAWHTAGIADDGAAISADRAFDPKYFLINGVPNTEALHDERVTIDAAAGDKVLIRMLNASFSLMRIKVDGLQGNIISVDGQALASADRPWTNWSAVQPSQPMFMAAGARHDVLIDLDPAKNLIERGRDHLVTFEFLDWEKRQVRNCSAKCPAHIGRAVTRIRIV
jgi:FtsP/CotA-like multicopper oxidase with cupredoxin domain